jgi:hypothetical protein
MKTKRQPGLGTLAWLVAFSLSSISGPLARGADKAPDGGSAAKPADTKPADAQSAGKKPADVKPADTKPANTKPAETKPAQTKPADVKPDDPKAGDEKASGAVKADPQYEVTLVEDTKWQPFGGSIRFEVRGPDLDSNPPKVTASLRWKEKGEDKQPQKREKADAKNFLPGSLVRVGTSQDQQGILYAVTVPLAWSDSRDRSEGVEKTFLLIPAAVLKVVVTPTARPKDEQREQPPPTEVRLEVGITAKVISGLWALAFLLIAGFLLYMFAVALKVPGKGVFLRTIASASGWASLAQFQIMLWTLLISAGAVYVMTLTGSLINISTGTLVILGIAGAATVGSQIKANQRSDPAPSEGGAPGPATHVALQESPGADHAILTWVPPPAAGGPSRYIVQYRQAPASPPAGDDGTWITAATSLASPPFRLVGLEPGTGYEARVYAFNVFGTSVATPTIGFATANAPPVAGGAPDAVASFAPKALPETGRAVALGWTAVAGPTYRIQYRRHDSAEDWRFASGKVDGGSTRVDNLRPDTEYDFRIFATKDGINGPTSPILRVRSGPRVPRWSDLVTETDRAPEVDVARVQMLLFTVVSAVFVALKIVDSSTIPPIPDTYVTLMGISNGVYLTAKFTSR